MYICNRFFLCMTILRGRKRFFYKDSLVVFTHKFVNLLFLTHNYRYTQFYLGFLIDFGYGTAPDNALFLYVRISFVSDSPAPGYFGGYCLVCGDFDMGASGRFASKFFCLQTERFDLAATGAFNIHLFCFTA